MVRVSNVTVRKRLVFVLFIGIIVFVVIAVRLGYVQFSMGNWLAKQAENSWGRDVPFEAKRGEILDRNDVVLATNVSAPSVLVAPRQVQDPVRTAEEIASVLEMDRTDAYELITKKPKPCQASGRTKNIEGKSERGKSATIAWRLHRGRQ